MTHITGFRPLAAVPYTPARPQDPVNHDNHYDPGHGTPPPRKDTGVDPAPPKNQGPACQACTKPPLDYM